jgi:hypothetical protein
LGSYDVGQLILKRASATRPSGECKDSDFDVLADGVTVGRIIKATASPVDASWLWTLAFGRHEDRTPTHGYSGTQMTQSFCCSA